MIRIQIGSAGLALPKTVTVTTAEEEPGSEPPAGQETSEESRAASDSTDSVETRPATVETRPTDPPKPGPGSRRARKSFR